MSHTNKPADLPFVGRIANKEQLSFWTIRPDGNFSDGTNTGAAMASAYIAYLSNTNAPPILPQIVIDMLATADLSPALQGQVVGFFAAIESKLTRETNHQG